jgi:hypothetical protein
MTSVVSNPFTDAAAWDDAPPPSRDLVRVLEDVERALVPPSALPTRPQPVAGPRPRPFAYD